MPVLASAALMAEEGCSVDATWGYADPIRSHDPAGSLKALSMCKDVSACQRVKVS